MEQLSEFGDMTEQEGPHEDTPIRIIHEYQGWELRNEFGVRLRTREKLVDRKIIRQHFLVDEERNGPADKMRIKNGDELALLNDIFVPEKTHHELIDIFHHVKIDGKTKLTLVIRRVQKSMTFESSSKQTEKKFEWVKTSAILAPDNTQKPDHQPLVKDVKYKEIHDTAYCMGHVQHRYRIKDKNMYINISEDGELSVIQEQSNDGDKTHILLRHGRCYTDNKGTISFDTALSDNKCKFYININIKNGTVSLEAKGQGIAIQLAVRGNRGHFLFHLQRSPDWFDYVAEGNDVSFKKNGVFLAEENKTIITSTQKYKFVEIDVKSKKPMPDVGVITALLRRYCNLM